jgi:hypothetical protein
VKSTIPGNGTEEKETKNLTSELNRNLPEDPEVNDRKRVKRAAREVSKDMLRGHIPENKTVCPEDERTCLLTLRIVWFQAFFIYYGLYSDRFNAQSSETTVQHGMGV